MRACYTRGGMVLVVLLLLGLGLARVAAQPSTLALSAAYFGREPGSNNTERQGLFAPYILVEGQPVEDVLSDVPTAEACSSACRAAPECDWFIYCDEQAGCALNSTVAVPDLVQRDCQLLAVNCSVQPVVEGSGLQDRIVSGFPVSQSPLRLSAFSAFEAQGVLGSDYECPESPVAGACAIADPLTAASTCIRSPECRAVVVYTRGLDGCSDTVALLKNAGLSPANGFVSPSVYTLQVSEPQSQESSYWLLASEGEVVLTPEAQATAANEALEQPGAWKGTILGRNAVMGGRRLATLDGIASALNCARACHDRGAGAGNFTGGCNVWNYCEQQGGCRYQDTDLNRELVELQEGQCQLRYQELANLSIGSPPTLLGKGSGVNFTAGAPLVEWGPAVGGYSRHIGQSLFASGRYSCPGSLRPQTSECVVGGSLEELAGNCSASDVCQAWILKPAFLLAGFVVNSTATLAGVGVLKSSVLPPPQWVLVPTAVLYVREGTPSSGSGLSAGAIAGIAVGCVAGLAVAAATAFLLLRRRRRRAGASSSSEPQKSASTSTLDELGAEEGRGGGMHRAVDLLPAGAGSGRTSPFAASLPTTGGSGGSGGRGSGPSSRRLSSAAQPFPGAARRGPLGAPSDSTLFSSLASPATSRLTSPGVSATSPRPTSGTEGAEPEASEAALPELVQHVAAKDAAALTSGGVSSEGSSDSPSLTLSVEALPPHLRDWVVHPGEFTPLRWPNGKPQEIGSGASARVYKVLYNGEVVAAKEMDIEASASMQEAFLKEAVWLHALRHPNIVSFYGCCIAGSRGIVLIEYCDGRDLYSALQVCASGSNQRLFSWSRRGRRVAFEIAKALNYLHSKGVVHMDIKSSNVLLTANGAVRVTDVGFSRQKTRTVLSNVQLVGTFAWIAPEILTGRQEVTEQADIYSMGVVLWEIVTGERPQRGKLRPPRVPEECPQEVADLMEECLREDPTERPTAPQLLQRLGEMLEKPKGAGGELAKPQA